MMVANCFPVPQEFDILEHGELEYCLYIVRVILSSYIYIVILYDDGL